MTENTGGIGKSVPAATSDLLVPEGRRGCSQGFAPRFKPSFYTHFRLKKPSEKKARTCNFQFNKTFESVHRVKHLV